MTAPRIPAELSEVVRRLDELEALIPKAFYGAPFDDDKYSIITEEDAKKMHAALDAVRTALADALAGMAIIPEADAQRIPRSEP